MKIVFLLFIFSLSYFQLPVSEGAHICDHKWLDWWDAKRVRYVYDYIADECQRLSLFYNSNFQTFESCMECRNKERKKK